MTLLTRWSADAPGDVVERTADPAAIAAALSERGIRYEQWPVAAALPTGAGQDEVFAAHRQDIDRLVAEGGYQVVDVAQLHPSDDPEWATTAATARERFLSEHTHAEDEVRFFVQGSGIFYLHLGHEVVAVLCEAGDLLAVPALTKHWFDMGTRPDFTAIRLFLDPDGWVGSFTDDPIASTFADYDELVATR